jgi:hypothetical protein
MTQDHYLGRRVVDGRVADALERAYRVADDGREGVSAG